jgi:tetratricopeptide (TPR) repeat protein
MAKKRRHRHKTPLQTSHSPEFQAAHALRSLREGHFKSAISSYKSLLSLESRQDWRDNLALAYEGRAGELADKGMFKEAVTLWQNRAHTCNKPLVSFHYLLWLLQSGLTDQALQHFGEEPNLLESETASFRIHLAALALSGEHFIVGALPEDDPVVRDYTIATQALQAYCDTDESALRAALAKISFRSPYRDLRILLKGLAELIDRPDEAAITLKRVKCQSPFAALARIALGVNQEGEALLNNLAPLDPVERSYALALKGWPESHRRFIDGLLTLHQSRGERFLLRFLIQQQAHLGAEYAQQAAYRVLVKYPDGISVHDEALGEPSQFHKSRILALLQEKLLADPYDIYLAWNEALEALSRQTDAKSPSSLLRAALILRRIADLLEEAEFDWELIAEVLEKSLQADPDDSPTYRRLIQLFRENRQFKQARRFQEQALNRYPQDIEILLEVVETSLASSAFKKAVQFAQRVLEIDPINSRVRRILFDAHIAHARKQIKQRKPDLAFKELDQAAQWDPGESARLQLELMRGIMEFRDNPVLGRKRLQVAMGQMDYSLKSRFLLLMEGQRLQTDATQLLRLAQPPNANDGRQQVMELMHSLQKISENEAHEAKQALDKLQIPLRQAICEAYTEVEMSLICETLKRLKEFDLRQRFAQAALKRWPERPLFVYHRYDAPIYINNVTDIRALEIALERARDEGDLRTVHRIVELLEGPRFFGKPKLHSAHRTHTDDDLSEGLEELLGELGTRGFLDLLESLGLPELEVFRQELGDDNIREAFEAMARGESPDEAVRKITGGRRGKKSRSTPRKSKSEDDHQECDKPSKQYDLF